LLRRLFFVLVTLTLLGACADTEERVAGSILDYERIGDFYDVPDPLPPAAPGTLIRTQRLLGAPEGTDAWRVLYHSTDVLGNDIAVSGIVIAPESIFATSNRPVVAWAHPTTGAVPRCAPSNGIDPFVSIEGMYELLDAGYAIAATDYANLGAPGPQSYLIGATEAHNMLDSVRAAQFIKDTGAGNDVLLWGHSQGGHAALFAAQEAPEYAPELDVKGVAVAAPATDLAALLRDDIGDISGVTIGAYAFNAYDKVYGPTDPGASLDQFLTPAGVRATPKAADYCLFGQQKELHAITRPLIGNYLAREPSEVEPWKTWLEANTPGAEPIGVPVFVAQGESDTLVRPAVTQSYVDRLCNQGERVHFERFPRTNHGEIAEFAAASARKYFENVLANRTVTNDCAREFRK
jgi:acetyl esterase/lipase